MYVMGNTEIMERFSIAIEFDSCPESPRTWDNLGCMEIRPSRNNSLVSETGHWSNEDAKDAVKLMVRAYNHSGIALKAFPVGVNEHQLGFPFSCRWDAYWCGTISARLQDIRKAFGVKRVSAKLRKRVEEILCNEVETYAKWLNGEVYRYEITDENGDYLEGCGGYYSTYDAETAAREMVEYYQNQSNS